MTIYVIVAFGITIISTVIILYKEWKAIESE